MSILRIPLMNSNAYIIQEEGTILVDGGMPYQIKNFMRELVKLSISSEDINLIIITHGHYDHYGSLKNIKEVTGAKVATHIKDKNCVEMGIKFIPPGLTLWAKILGAMCRTILPIAVHFQGASVDIILDNSAFDLTPYGIKGRIIYTPGHTPGSISIILDNGDAIVGDLAMNGIPLRFGVGMPIWAEPYNSEKSVIFNNIQASWRKILDSGAKTIYPGHGKPFSASVLETLLSKNKSAFL